MGGGRTTRARDYRLTAPFIVHQAPTDISRTIRAVLLRGWSGSAPWDAVEDTVTDLPHD